ncbi:MAG TPA: AraC family transcriptional regulator [Bryobacteraceae bacterium]|nr:AraC family transcriptional regulator [Bryobacteraceae bacterium]
MTTVREELERALKHRAVHCLPGSAAARVIAGGPGWTVSDVVCTSGPRDRAFEEQHTGFSIAIVAAGTFQYRSTKGQELMTPGSLLLGNPGQRFECGHEHGEGDRCLSFYYEPDYFENLAADCGLRAGKPAFRALRLPPAREFSRLTAQGCSALANRLDRDSDDWEGLGIRLAAQAVRLTGSSRAPSAPGSVARVTRVLRSIEKQFDTTLDLRSLAQQAGLSPYHFLRTFEHLTGVTPHQFLLRARLREAATRLTLLSSKIVDIALDCGFADVSNFNRAFRKEFGVSPRQYRMRPFQVRTN